MSATVIMGGWKVSLQTCVKDRERILKREEKARSILLDNYEDVYDFFCDVLEEKKEYKILRARRSQVLFRIFYPIILLNEGENINVYGTFLSDHAVYKYREQIKKNSVLIVDDIVIHGRGLRRLYESIDPGYERADVNIHVCCKSRNAKLDDRLLQRLKSKPEDAFNWEWRRLSCQFVNLIYACATPYISFVGSYYTRGAYVCVKNFDTDFIVMDNSTSYQRIQGEESWVLFERKRDVALFDRLGYDSCLRVSGSTYIDEITYIPYVFVKKMDTSTAGEIITWTCQRISSEKTSGIVRELCMKEQSQDALLYQMKLFSTLINHAYGLYLRDRYKDIFTDMSLDREMLALCYGADIAQEFAELNYADIRGLFQEELPDFVEPLVEEDKELEMILEQIKSDSCIHKELAERYFFENGKVDENRAQRRKERKKGLTVGRFYEGIKGDEVHEVSASQLQVWDSGIASCNIGIHKGVVGSYVAAGEQSFRYVLEKYKDLVRDMLYQSNSPLWEKGHKTGAEQAMECYSEYMKVHGNDTGIEVLKEFVYEHKDNLEEWGIPEIFA